MVRVRLRASIAAEPNSHLPLRWGDHRGRAAVGVALLVAGAVLIAQTSAVTFSMGVLGSALHLAGWLVEPARIRSRALVALPSMVACWATVAGPPAMWLLAACLGCFLLVRRRPPRSYLVIALPLVVALAAVAGAGAGKAAAFAAVGTAAVAGARLARELALRVRIEGSPMRSIGTSRREGSDGA